MTAPDTPDPDPDPVYELPERAVLDPESAAALALSEVLPGMLEPHGEDGAMAIDYKVIARTVLAAVESMPRVPPWEGPRTIGGARRDGRRWPDPEVSVDARDGQVWLVVTTQADPGRTATDALRVAPADARSWFLAGLAATAAAESAPSGAKE